MALVPPAEEGPAFGRYEVQYATAEAPGTIIIDTKTRLLHFALPGGKAIRYGVTVGDEAFAGRVRHGLPARRSGRPGTRPQRW